jgi:uncharacterized repeat protein (TIGR01451 family)
MNSRLLSVLLLCLLGPALCWAQVDEGLVAHWPLDEPSGTIASDASGNGLDATVFGATWTQGRIGGALRFDGVSNFVQVPDAGLTPPQQIGALNQGTIAFWLRFEDPDNVLQVAGFPIFYFGSEPSSSESWDLEIYIGHAERFATDDRRIYYTYHRAQSDGSRQAVLCFNSAQRLEENTWYHYAVVIGPDGNKGYLNGEEMTDRIFNFGDPSRTDFFNDVQVQDILTLGYGWSTPAGGFTYFNGLLDDVRIYNRPLSAAEIGVLAGDGDGVGSIYEAEDAVVISPAFVGSRTDGFTGTGYVRFPKSGGSVEFAVDVPNGDTYDLKFRYGLSSGEWTGEVRIDGDVIGPMLALPATGSWANWQSVRTATALASGSHTISVTSVVPVALNLDHLELQANGGPAPDAADLSVSKSDAPDPVQVGQVLTYTLQAQNNGPDSASNLVLTESLPTGLGFVSANASQGTCAQGGGIVTCNLGSLANGGLATVTVVVTAAAAGIINNAASVTAAESDPVPGNNTASESTTVESLPSGPLEVIDVSPDVLAPGESAQLVVTGTGFEAGATVVVCRTGGVSVDNVQVVNANTILVDVTVAADKDPGICGLRVINPDGERDTLVPAFVIQ